MIGNWSSAISANVWTARSFADTANHLYSSGLLWMSGPGFPVVVNRPTTIGSVPTIMCRAPRPLRFSFVLNLSVNSHPGLGGVCPQSTFAEDIEMLASAGITKGCNPTTHDEFCPDDPITRGELAAFLNGRCVVMAARLCGLGAGVSFLGLR